MTTHIPVPLKRGVKIGDVVYKHAQVREALVEDSMAAEDIAPPSAFYKHNANLMCACVSELSTDGKEGSPTFKGPFVAQHFAPMGRVDFDKLVIAMNQAEAEGNEPQDAAKNSSAAS